MTKLRTPLTFADAMTRVAGAIGWPECCRITGRADRTVRAWSDPETKTVPPIDQCRDLDVAYREAGGEGSPFLEAYEFQLGVHFDRQDACRRALSAEVGATMAEIGQALAAALVLTDPGASPRDALRAFAETQQADAAVATLLRRIASFLPSGAGLEAGRDGGTTP